ncbi:MAG: UDP-N-acetylmuramoyl-tripeptide--D-alanyl-D-alanine ligase [Planctomycetota bacterium]
MIRFTLDEILDHVPVQWSAGRIRPRDVRVTAVSTDSRSIEPGALFVGIAGPRFDGAAFAADAVAAGAVAVLATDEPGVREKLAKVCLEHDVVVATAVDATAALGQIAALVRSRLDVPVVGITGSCGKTSTKEMLRDLLSASRRTVASPASFNNQIGVPRTIFLADEATEALVLEIGMNHPGEIAPLARIARPRVGVVTMIGRAHLEALETVEGIAREKGALLEALDPNLTPGATAVVNRDCPHTPLLLDRVREGVRVLSTSAEGDPSASLFARDVNVVREGTRCTLDGPALPASLRGRTVEIPLLGEHAVANLLAALGAVIASGADVAAALDAVGDLAPAPHRLQPLHAGGVLVVDDSYNANPDSMRAALDVLARLRLPRTVSGRPRRILAVGEMGELGADSVRLHREAGAYARRIGVDLVLGVGDVGPRTPLAAFLEGARSPGLFADHAATIDEALELLTRGPDSLRRGDAILLKASRAAGLDRLATGIVDALGSAAEVAL